MESGSGCLSRIGGSRRNREVRVHRMRKITVPLRLCGHNRAVHKRTLDLAQSAIRKEKKRLVSLHGAANSCAKLIPMERGIGRIVPVVRVQRVVAPEFEK